MKPQSPTDTSTRKTAITGPLFIFRPTPSLRALSHPPALISPPPPGRGEEPASVDLRERAAGWLVRLFPFPVRSLTAFVRFFHIDPLAGWVDCDVHRFCQLIFSSSVSEWGGGGGSVGAEGGGGGCVICRMR